MTPQDVEVAVAEYQSAQDAYLHYDGFRWQAGSFLIAGVFIFWGLMVQQPLASSSTICASFLVTALMSGWVLYAHHYRQIYLCKLHRIHELEADLGMLQHLRFSRFQPRALGVQYRTFGPRGHNLDLFVYAVTVVGTPLLGTAADGFHVTYLAPIVLGALVVALVLHDERAVLDQLRPQTRLAAPP